MSKRVTAVRRKSTTRIPNRAAPGKKKVSKRKAGAAAAAKKPAARKPKAAAPKKKAVRKKVAAGKKKPAVAASARRKATPKRAPAKPAKVAKKVAAAARPRVALVEKQKTARGIAKAKVVAKVVASRHDRRSVPSSAPATPRSVTPPPVSAPVQPAKMRVKVPVKIAVRAAYVSPAQRVLEAQAAAQSRARRIQATKEESQARQEPSPASEVVVPAADNGTASSEPRTSAAFVRRGRLGPRDLATNPGSEPQSSAMGTPEAFDREWKLIQATAQKASIKLERELVQGWLEPWLSGKDTLALVRSATKSTDAYFVAAEALARKFIVIQRTANIASEIATRFGRLGFNVFAVSASGSDRASTLGRFASATAGVLVVALDAFDDDSLVTELQQLKVNGLVAEEAQRVSELSFDFNVAYDRVPTIITRLGRPPTQARNR